MGALTKSKTNNIEHEVETTFDKPIYIPETDIYEEDDAIYVIANVPGVDENNINIELENNVLTFTATQEESVMEGYKKLGDSDPTGIFKRSFKIETEINQDEITALVKHGVLQIKLPKAEELKPRHIKVIAG